MKKKIIMLKFRCIFSIILMGSLLNGCDTMPGMQNLNLSHTPVINHMDYFKSSPTLMLITPDLLLRERSKTNHYDYKVSPADVLDIVVWQHPEFLIIDSKSSSVSNAPSEQGASGQIGYLVNANGSIYFPLVGYLAVAGKTVDQIRSELTTRLKKYIKDPQINIRVADYRGKKIYVFGEVMKQGFIPFNDQPLTIADALAMSGSFDPNASDPKHVYIIRGEYSNPKIYWLNAKSPASMLLAEHFNLEPDDILFVAASSSAHWNRVINQILPTLQAAWLTKAMATSN